MFCAARRETYVVSSSEAIGPLGWEGVMWWLLSHHFCSGQAVVAQDLAETGESLCRWPWPGGFYGLLLLLLGGCGWQSSYLPGYQLPLPPEHAWELRSRSGAASREEDGPHVHPVTDLPTVNELTPSEDTVEYLEVGIVVGADPFKYRGSKPAQNAERLKRGNMPRDKSAIRAFIHVKEKV